LWFSKVTPSFCHNQIFTGLSRVFPCVRSHAAQNATSLVLSTFAPGGNSPHTCSSARFAPWGSHLAPLEDSSEIVISIGAVIGTVQAPSHSRTSQVCSSRNFRTSPFQPARAPKVTVKHTRSSTPGHTEAAAVMGAGSALPRGTPPSRPAPPRASWRWPD